MRDSRVNRPAVTVSAVGTLDQYRRLIESLTDYAIFYISADGIIETWNAGATKSFGYDDREAIGQHYRLIFTEEDRASGLPEAELATARSCGKAAIDGWHVRKDLSKFWCTNTVQSLTDGRGKLRGFTKIVKDSTEQHEAAEALRQSEERLRLLIEGVTGYALFSISALGCIMSWNSGARSMYGYEESEIVGKPLSLLYSQESVAAGALEAELVAAKTGQVESSCWHVRKDGSRFFASGQMTLLENDERDCPRGFVKIAHDMTARNTIEERLRQQAFNDALTALPNRVSFGEYLGRTIAEAQLTAGICFAVFYLDLDHFKEINDSFGHAVGDGLLVAFARLLERCSRPGDIVARVGGDEFTLLLPNVNTTKDAISVAERIHSALKKPFSIGGYEIATSASIGIAVGSSLYLAADQIIRDADSAMYEAKMRGGGRHALFPFGGTTLLTVRA